MGNLPQIITYKDLLLCSLLVTPQISQISYACVSITKSVGLKQLSTQQFGLGRIYSTLLSIFWSN